MYQEPLQLEYDAYGKPHFSARVSGAGSSSSSNNQDLTKQVSEQEVERLRRFLSQALSLDYYVRDACPDKFRKDDWYHFTNLAIVAHNVHYSHHRRSAEDTILLGWDDNCCRHPEIDKFLKAPAAALRIETRIVVAMLYSFVCRHGWFSPPSKRMGLKTEERHGARALAEKLMRDQNQLFDVIIPLGATGYREMIDRAHNRQMTPFVRLKSAEDYVVRGLDQRRLEGPDGWQHYYCFEETVYKGAVDHIQKLKDAIDGFPSDPMPTSFRKRLWREQVVKKRAEKCVKDMFGLELAGCGENESKVPALERFEE